jgi:hypothetical protein
MQPADLDVFPESLQGRHSTATWLLCLQQFVNKKQQLL